MLFWSCRLRQHAAGWAGKRPRSCSSLSGRRVLKMLGQLGGGVKGTESRDFLPPLPQFWMLLNLPVWAPDWRVKVQYFRVWLRFHGDICTDFFKLRGVIDTIETHSLVSMTPRSVLHMWISPWNRNYSTVYAKIVILQHWIPGPNGLESWRKRGVENLVTLSTSCR